MEFVNLIKDAELKFGRMQGKGLGAVLLAAIIIFSIYFFSHTPSALAAIANIAFSSGK